MLLGVRAVGNLVGTVQQSVTAERKSLRMKKISYDLFDQIDTNKDGALQRSEFLRYALLKFEYVEKGDLDLIDALFDSLDVRKDGTLTKDEIVAGCDR